MKITVLEKAGSSVSDKNNVADVLGKVNGAFEPMIVPNFYRFNGLEQKSRKSEVIRSDNGGSLGTMSDGYKAISNGRAFEVLDLLANQTGATFERAGEFKGKFFVSLKLPHSVAPKKRPNDKSEIYFTGFNSFDGSTPVAFSEHAHRIVCQNTFYSALAQSFERVRHSGLTVEKLEVVKYQMAFIAQQMSDLQTRIDRLEDIPFTLKEMENFSTRLLSKGEQNESKRFLNRVNSLTELFVNGDGAEGRTAYDAFNAVTEYLDHYSVNKDTEGATKEENLFESSFLGENSRIKVRAMDLLLA